MSLLARSARQAVRAAAGAAGVSRVAATVPRAVAAAACVPVRALAATPRLRQPTEGSGLPNVLCPLLSPV
jgi:hypothetical protein